MKAIKQCQQKELRAKLGGKPHKTG